LQVREKVGPADTSDVDPWIFQGMQQCVVPGFEEVETVLRSGQPRVLFATEGRDANTVAAFAYDLSAHRGDPDAIDEVCTDMSPASSKASPGVYPTPSTSSTLSRSSTTPSIRCATPNRKGKVCYHPLYLVARPSQPVRPATAKTLENLPTRHLKTARAYQIRLAFQDLYETGGRRGRHRA
jgi:transposase